MPINPDWLAAYFNAGLATIAYEYGIAVERLSLRVRDGRRDRPRVQPLQEYVKFQAGGEDPMLPFVGYATTLLAGSAGRFIGLDAHLAYPRPHIDQDRLKRAHLAEAQMCLEPETDRAFALIVGRLEGMHHGDADETFRHLWGSAHWLLRQPPNNERLARIVNELRRRRTLDGEEIAGLLSV